MYLSRNFQGSKFRGAIGILALAGAGHAAIGAAVQVDKLLANDGAAGDSFGRAVAVDGNLAIVGAPWNDTEGIDAGAAYIYRLDGGGWVQEAKLTASDGAGGDEFGIAVDISGDVAIVGAWQHNGTGAAYIYRLNGGSWDPEAKLVGEATPDRFGISVAIDGEIAVVGADKGDKGDPEDPVSDCGAAYIYSAGWEEVTKLVAFDAAQFDEFGCAVDIDGDVVVVGARFGDSGAVGSGAAYVFSGSSWGVETKLTVSDAAAADHFGESVSISGDTIVVGSPGDGSAWAFTDDGSAWVDEKLTGSLAGAAETFGYAVAVSGDVIAVGAHTANTQSGLLTIFQRSAFGWSEVEYFMPADWAEYDQFGRAVGISSQNVLIVGSPGDEGEDPAPLNAGSAYWLQFTPELDTDGDGLFDSEELALGTDPLDPDTDFDGMEDGAEVEMADGGPCPDPLVRDSDNDGIDDGIEVYLMHTDPCDIVDTDGDGLSDDDEINLYGTDHEFADTDGDGLSDFVEVGMALDNAYLPAEIKAGDSCPRPWGPEGWDSDNDGWSDGTEVGYDEVPGTGTSPCNPDSDGDGEYDADDPAPLDPEVTSGWIEDELRLTSADIDELDLSFIEAQNENAAKGRRNAMSNKVNAAANLVALGDFSAAADQLMSLLAKLDDDPTPPDWMVEGTDEKQALRTEIELMIDLLYYEL